MDDEKKKPARIFEARMPLAVNGQRLGVKFVAGVGQTPDANVAAQLRDLGYTVREVTAKK